ncbi:MAG: hypothetical protein ACOVO1_12845 [Chitinophagaceae bacterium]
MRKIITTICMMICVVFAGKAQQDNNTINTDTVVNVFSDTTDKNINSLMFLNAGKFDFGKSKFGDYAFHLNVFAPNVTDKRWGLNLGIMKINYSQTSDSLDVSKYKTIDRVLISPFDSVKAGNKYLRQLNNYNRTVENTAISYYVQPTFKIVKQPKFGLLGHLHFELLSSAYTVETEISNTYQDTAIMDNALVPYQTTNLFANGLNEKSTNAKRFTNLSFMLGAGFIVYAKPFKGTTIFIQPTLGVAVGYKQPSILDLNSPSNNKLFYLTRIYLQQDITDNLKAIIGFDSRGAFNEGNITNQYAAYVGVNLGLSGLKELFK